MKTIVVTSRQMLVFYLCNVKSCLNTSNNEIFTNKRGDLPCVNISKHTCPVVKWSDEKFVLVYIYLSF